MDEIQHSTHPDASSLQVVELPLIDPDVQASFVKKLRVRSTAIAVLPALTLFAPLHHASQINIAICTMLAALALILVEGFRPRRIPTLRATVEGLTFEKTAWTRSGIASIDRTNTLLKLNFTDGGSRPIDLTDVGVRGIHTLALLLDLARVRGVRVQEAGHPGADTPNLADGILLPLREPKRRLHVHFHPWIVAAFCALIIRHLALYTQHADNRLPVAVRDCFVLLLLLFRYVVAPGKNPTLLADDQGLTFIYDWSETTVPWNKIETIHRASCELFVEQRDERTRCISLLHVVSEQAWATLEDILVAAKNNGVSAMEKFVTTSESSVLS